MIRTNAKHPHFIALVKELDALLTIVDGDKHAYYHQFNGIDDIPYAVVAYRNDLPVACGAIKPYSDTTAEIKRMFTHHDARGQGLGKSVLLELEQWAKELGFMELLLETGVSFKAAVQLYQSNGFTPTANYDQYIGQADSVCFSKEIK